MSDEEGSNSPEESPETSSKEKSDEEGKSYDYWIHSAALESVSGIYLQFQPKLQLSLYGNWQVSSRYLAKAMPWLNCDQCLPIDYARC